MQSNLVLLPVIDGRDISISPLGICEVEISDQFIVTLTMQSGNKYQYKIENIERRLAYYMDPPIEPSRGYDKPMKAMTSKQAHEYLKFQERRRLTGYVKEAEETHYWHLRRYED
ncbi:hypothetical protein Nazgul30 [Burkholderia phage BcepNazgul]|uniref:Uncharacterized protein n=1 Tax=Burkholderia phage BcepNazgul TaxID=242861 RepID=Q2HPF4_9CAUD|nr:hypothetical protein Nazgul30 [Burkholderia phage BcepNazgul]ABD46773.1 hypothetical protein Nazgul30 [Burkholderia phage BcepNazgul]